VGPGHRCHSRSARKGGVEWGAAVTTQAAAAPGWNGRSCSVQTALATSSSFWAPPPPTPASVAHVFVLRLAATARLLVILRLVATARLLVVLRLAAVAISSVLGVVVGPGVAWRVLVTVAKAVLQERVGLRGVRRSRHKRQQHLAGMGEAALCRLLLLQAAVSGPPRPQPPRPLLTFSSSGLPPLPGSLSSSGLSPLPGSSSSSGLPPSPSAAFSALLLGPELPGGSWSPLPKPFCKRGWPQVGLSC
jgi:hypothetical protein